VLPATNIWIFDPSVFIDDDGQAYAYFGGNGESNVRIIRLNDDMISTSGSAIALTVQYFFEAAWMHKRNGVYYLSYSTNPSNGLRIDYLTSDNPMGPFTYRGIVARQPPSNNNNNHAAIFELNGAWYEVYHNRIVATQAGIPTVYRRNLAVERFDYNADGTIQQVTYTTDGVPQAHYLDPYARVEGETMHAQSGIETEPCSEGGMNVRDIESGDWIRIRGVDFGSTGAAEFHSRVASAASGGSIELRLDSLTGTLVGTCTVSGTGGGQVWTMATCAVSGATGVHDLFLRFTGGSGSLLNLNWWQFAEPLAIIGQPRSLTLAIGARLSLWVEISRTVSPGFQWRKNGAPIAGATGRFLEVASAAPSDAANYSVEVSNSLGSVVSDIATVSIDAAASARIVNLSVRGPLASGATVIPGFVIGGTDPRQLLIRAVGPGLQQFNISNFLGDPRLTLYAGQASLLTNDNWGAASNATEIASVGDALNAFPLATGSLDAAALVDLTPALYTTHVTGAAGASGIALFEIYEGAGGNSRFLNISARADIGTGDNIMIPGFSVQGTGAKTLLIRAVGPSLERFNVSGRLADPVLTIYQGTTPILTSDNWGDAPDVPALNAASSAVSAFGLNDGGTDAAALVVLMPGTYTALARGVGGAIGNVLVEVYEVQ
jgi:hypothetical protein